MSDYADVYRTALEAVTLQMLSQHDIPQDALRLAKAILTECDPDSSLGKVIIRKIDELLTI